ncbi:hypothetical protein Scep_030408 [Stephania cephalantha]|uniref:Membrane-associated kinase regulator 1 n=1 Tax=Stephania cephalantha TaxID=152367 RepID=A0AAP0HGG6_9MAGN
MAKKSTQSPQHTSQISTASPTNSISSSSSMSDFEFSLSISPRKASANQCPADELFYKGQILPLQLSPRLSMVRTLTNSSTSDRSRDSTGSSNSTDSNTSSSSSAASTDFLLGNECNNNSRRSFEKDDDLTRMLSCPVDGNRRNPRTRKLKYFTLPRLPSVFSKKESKNRKFQHESTANNNNSNNNLNVKSVKRMSASANQMIRRYLKKVKPLYEKLLHKQHQNQIREEEKKCENYWSDSTKVVEVVENGGSRISHSFSGNLRYPMRRRSSCGSSCPSSIRSSPNHSGVLCGVSESIVVDSSSMDELQNAIQGAIAHCKQSLSRQLSMEKSSEQREEGSARLLAADGGGLLAADGGGRGGGVPPVHTRRDLGEAESRELGDATEMQRDREGDQRPERGMHREDLGEARAGEWFWGFRWKERKKLSFCCFLPAMKS